MIDRLFGHVQAGMNALASVWIMVLMLLICSDVLGRAFLHAPIPGVPEIVKFSIVAMFWLQMAYTLRMGRHLRSDLILNAVPRIARRGILLVNAALGITIFLLIFHFALIELEKVYEIGAFEGEHPVRVPIWPIWAILVLGAAFTAIQYLIEAVRVVRGDAPAAESELLVEPGVLPDDFDPQTGTKL